MQSKKKMIVNTVFLVVIFALTIYGVFHGEDLGAMMEAMRRADVRWLLPGLFCVVFFIWGESIIIWYMMHSFQIPVKKHFYSIPILIFYGLAGVIRLGYFNVMEEKRQNETSENRKYYQGLPITSMSVALPLLFVFAPLCRGYFLIWLHLLVLAVGVLFITDFRFRKPTNKELAVLVAVVGVAVLRGLLIWKGGRTI